MAEATNARTGPITVAWLLAQHTSIAPIPGTRSSRRTAENTASTLITLSADDLADLNSLANQVGVHGDRYNTHHMALVNR